MSEITAPGCDCPDSAETLGRQIHEQVDEIITYCQSCQTSFARFEKELFARLQLFGCLFVSLFLLARHQRLDLKTWRAGHRLVDASAPRLLKTLFGTVRYARAYLARRRGHGGFHPLDAALGLTRDTFSPGVITLATRLTTRLSFKTSELLLKAFWGWSPSTESLEHLVLGIGRLAPKYMSSAPPFPEPEGEILVIEVDGKAARWCGRPRCSSGAGRGGTARIVLVVASVIGDERGGGRRGRASPGKNGHMTKTAAVPPWWSCTPCGVATMACYTVRSTNVSGAVSRSASRCCAGRVPKRHAGVFPRTPPNGSKCCSTENVVWNWGCRSCFRRRLLPWTFATWKKSWHRQGEPFMRRAAPNWQRG
jgi:hypothetical protein